MRRRDRKTPKSGNPRRPSSHRLCRTRVRDPPMRSSCSTAQISTNGSARGTVRPPRGLSSTGASSSTRRRGTSKPGEWQAYDVVWHAPTFGPDGALAAPARVTVFFNGVLVQDDFALRGETVFIGTPAYTKHGDSPIKLQAHNDPSAPLGFRNIWV